VNDDLDAAAASVREAVAAAVMAEDWWWREAQRHRDEGERWQRRVELAERHQEFDLATEAAQRARHHAALALAAEGQYAQQQARVRLLKLEMRAHPPMTPSPVPPGVAASLEARFTRLERETQIDAQLAAIRAGTRMMDGEAQQCPTD
jgi:phage shock protein A